MSAPAAIKATIKAPRGSLLTLRLTNLSLPEPMSGCWIWCSSRRGYRYGSLRIGGRSIAAHRASWEAFRGPIPDGLCVLHRCDNGFCINPDHLFLGTHLDNARDRETKKRGNQPRGLRNGRHTKPHRTARGDRHYTHKTLGLKAGEKNGRAKLTWVKVEEIRASSLSAYALAPLFGVSKTTILGIRKGRLWQTR